jgi:hypothetical protein
MAEVLEQLTPRLQRQAERLLVQQQNQSGWHGNRPVLLLDRCWLQLRQVAVADLARVLPPDSSAAAPELVRFRELRRGGLDHFQAEERCWQEFGRQACSDALQRYWHLQEQGNHGWTLDTYLRLLDHYRRCLENAGPSPIPLLVLARSGSDEPHHLHWCWPPSQAMRHTCA